MVLPSSQREPWPHANSRNSKPVEIGRMEELRPSRAAVAGNGEHFVRKYRSDPVSTISLFGEVSEKEAEKVWGRHKSVRKSLLSIEAKKKKRKFCIEVILVIILIIGLIIIYDWGLDQIQDAKNDPRKNTFYTTLDQYEEGVPIPLLIFSDHGGNPDFRWIIEQHPVSGNWNTSACEIEIHGSHVRDCITCGFEKEIALCNTNSENRMLCHDGSESPQLGPGETFDHWLFCDERNSTRFKCPSSKPWKSGHKNVMDQTEYGCGDAILTKYSPSAIPFHTCENGTIPMNSPSTCERNVVELPLDDAYDTGVFDNPGLYRICDSTCLYIIVPTFKYADNEIYKVEVYVRHNGGQIMVTTFSESANDCDNWKCFHTNYLDWDQGDRITYLDLGSKYKMKVSYRVLEKLDGNDEFNMELDVSSRANAMWSNISLVEFEPEPSILVIQEYQHYSNSDIFNLMASYLTIWRAFSFVVSAIILANNIPLWFLRWVPRYSEPKFSNRFREKLWIMQQHDDMLVGMPEDWKHKTDLINIEQTKNLFQDMMQNIRSPHTNSDSVEYENDKIEVVDNPKSETTAIPYY